MPKNIVAIALIFFIGVSSFAQNSVNDYKYVVVPLQFDFFKGKDRFRTSTLTRYLFKQEGFEVYYDEEKFPEELFNDRCLALYADVLKISSFFKTKVQIELKDCYGNIVFLSGEGSTKIKEHEEAYPVVIREAFESIKFLNYSYNPNSNVGSKKQVVSKAESSKEEIEKTKAAQAEVDRLKKEVEDLKNQKEIEKTKSELKAKSEAEAKRLEEEKLKNQKLQEQKQKLEISDNKVNSDLLYAQPNEKGFQLIDTSPKVIMVLIKTAAPNVYTVKGKDAIVFKEDGVWFYSENDKKTALNIKF